MIKRDQVDLNRYTPPTKWGVLCIDCWEFGGNNDHQYLKMLENLSTINIAAVVNCSKGIRLDYEDFSVYNTLKKYVWNYEPDNATVDPIKNRIILDLLLNCGLNKTSKVINQGLFKQHTIASYNQETFKQHVHLYYPDVKDWIIIGSAWDMCVKTGNLGLEKLVELPDFRFHIFPWGIQRSDFKTITTQDLEEDFYVWTNMPNDGYLLLGKGYND